MLAVTAARMIVEDKMVDRVIGESGHLVVLVGLSVIALVIILVPNLLRWRRERNDVPHRKSAARDRIQRLKY